MRDPASIYSVETPFTPVGAHNDGLGISAAQTLTPPSPDVSKIMIQALGQNVRYTLDGTTPTATMGFQLKAADPPRILHIASATVLKVIEEAVTADLQFQWGK